MSDKADKDEKQAPGKGTMFAGQFDVSKLSAEIRSAYEAGAASNRATIDSLSRLIDALSRDNESLRVVNLAQLEKLSVLAGANVTEHVLRMQAQNEDTRVRETAETWRAAIAAFGPAAAPLLALAGDKLAKLLPATAGGDGRDATARLIRTLLNGSEESNAAVGLLEALAGETDWPLVQAFLVSMAPAS